VPASRPSGAPTATPITVRIRLPAIAFRSPPELPGGGVICVKTASERPEKPCQNSTTIIMNRPISPMAAATTLRLIQILFLQRRAA
jgi:hypothetical protein